MHNKSGNYEKALQAYDLAIELDPLFSAPWNGKGIVYDKLGTYENALQACNKAIELDPTSSSHWNVKGHVYDKLGKYENALQAFEKAIELDPTCSLNWHEKGYTYEMLGNYENALQAFEKAIELNPTSSITWYGKGAAYDKLGKYENALHAYEKAIELDPSFSAPWLGKGNAYDKLGRINESISCFRRFLFLDNGKGIRKYSTFLINTFKSKTYAPYLLKYKISNNLLSNNSLGIFENKINSAIEECELVETYLLYLDLLYKSSHNRLQYYSLLALANYYFGDPMESYRIYDKIIDDELDSIDLMGQYYFLKSAIGFLEPLESIKLFALKQATAYGQLEKDFDIQQMYYAGQIFYLANDITNALMCFKKTPGFLPSEYMQLQIFLSQTHTHAFEDKKNYIVSIEDSIENQPLESYLYGISKQYIDINNEDYLQDFMKFFHLNEIIKPLSVVNYYIEGIGNDIDNELLELGKFFKIRESEHITIINKISENIIENIDKEFNQYMNTEIKQESFKIESSEVHSYSKLKEKLDSFSQCSKSDELEKYLAVFIKEDEYKKEVYLKFLRYFLYKKKISYFQALCLYLFTEKGKMSGKVFHEFISKSQGDILKTMLSLIGLPLGLLANLTTNVVLTVVKTIDEYIETIDELTHYENFKELIFERWSELIINSQKEFDNTIYGKAFDKWLQIN